MKICTIGGATQDVFIHNKDAQTVEFHNNGATKSYLLFPEGAKLEVDSLVYRTGGGCTNSATSFSRLGLDVEVFCKIGADVQGQFILQELKKAGLSTQFIAQSKTEHTGISFIIPSPDGDSTILAYRGANATLEERELPLKAIPHVSAYYITSLSGPSSQLLVPITEHAKKSGALVATNPGTSQLASGAHALRKSLKNIDIFILNAQEAQTFMRTLAEEEGIEKPLQKEVKKQAPYLLQNLLTYQDMCFNIGHFFSHVQEYGPKIIVVTNGKEGVYVFANSTIYFHPSLSANLVNTVGAGDAFGSCFVGSILKGKSPQEALIHGIINSSSVISYLDAKEGQLTWEQIVKKAAVVGLNGIQSFDV